MILEELISILGWDIRGEDELRRYRAQMRAAKAEAQSLARSVVGAFAVFSGIQGVKNIALIGDEMDALEKRFASFGQSDDLRFIEVQAERLGLRFKDAAGEYLGLSQALKGTAAEDDTRDVFVGLAEALTAMRRPAEAQTRAFKAFEQIASKGRVQAEELRGQLGEHIPGAFKIAAKAMNVTEAELNKLLETGKVVSSDFLPKFARQLGKEFAPALDASTKAMSANIARFMNGWDMARRQIGQGGFLDELNTSLEQTNALLGSDEARRFFRDLGYGLGRAVRFFRSLTTGAAQFFKQFSGQNIAIVAAALATAFFPVTAALGGILLLLEDVAVWARGGTSLFGGLYDTIARLAEAFSPIRDAIAGVITGITGMNSELATVAATLLGILASFKLLKGAVALAAGGAVAAAGGPDEKEKPDGSKKPKKKKRSPAKKGLGLALAVAVADEVLEKSEGYRSIKDRAAAGKEAVEAQASESGFGPASSEAIGFLGAIGSLVNDAKEAVASAVTPEKTAVIAERSEDLRKEVAPYVPVIEGLSLPVDSEIQQGGMSVANSSVVNNVTNNTNMTTTINGAGDPKRTATEVGGVLDKILGRSDAHNAARNSSPMGFSR